LYHDLDFDAVRALLATEDAGAIESLYQHAMQTRNDVIGNKVYLRGLIEYSNRCAKNCYYCGIRAGNKKAYRYEVSDEEVLKAAEYAWRKNYGSIVIQSGERSSKKFTDQISTLIKKIHIQTQGQLRITLSCGEQSEEVYREWYELGAKRYLLRIEASNPDLYRKLHPNNTKHSYQRRLQSINDLVKIGYQAGTGVMIGLPFQTIDNLAEDLFFIKDTGVHMVGMGPYIEHAETPLFKYKNLLLSPEKRVQLSLKMIALLRLMRPRINIASTTALQTLDPRGREKGLMAGANVVMPNITPINYKKEYNLYEGKPGLVDQPDQSGQLIEQIIESAGCVLALGDWGDSRFYNDQHSGR
jgi:biotin synthase